MKYCNENNKMEAISQRYSTLDAKSNSIPSKVVSIVQARAAKTSRLAREQVLQKARKLDW